MTCIEKLPPLPSTLRYLYCHNTPITELPELPSSLNKLNCSNTQIKKHPFIPFNVEYLQFNNTPFEHFDKEYNKLREMKQNNIDEDERVYEPQVCKVK
jgi:Leucine-rich repeat (LRR) protein